MSGLHAVITAYVLSGALVGVYGLRVWLGLRRVRRRGADVEG